MSLVAGLWKCALLTSMSAIFVTPLGLCSAMANDVSNFIASPGGMAANMLSSLYVLISFATSLERYFSSFVPAPLSMSTHLVPMGFLPVTSQQCEIGTTSHTPCLSTSASSSSLAFLTLVESSFRPVFWSTNA
jgi:hypothetical protein